MDERRRSGADEAQNDWIEWGGGDCPVEPEALVNIKCWHEKLWPDSVKCAPSKAGALRWQHAGLGGDIISYSVLSA
ncbi:p089 [Rhizobium phage 16-3]|uniref:p089 n=1 Tax=Rhizobium phage 16-3 TaxID=10704 RepID=UPI00017BA652|nr:p089 [Rhizobium phage 16-3]ABF71337.1 p089 [Rhizobium phage 16-3]